MVDNGQFISIHRSDFMESISRILNNPFITRLLVYPNVIFIHLKYATCPFSKRNGGIPKTFVILRR